MEVEPSENSLHGRDLRDVPASECLVEVGSRFEHISVGGGEEGECERANQPSTRANEQHAQDSLHVHDLRDVPASECLVEANDTAERVAVWREEGECENSFGWTCR